jgi:hypothetical protein
MSSKAFHAGVACNSKYSLPGFWEYEYAPSVALQDNRQAINSGRCCRSVLVSGLTEWYPRKTAADADNDRLCFPNTLSMEYAMAMDKSRIVQLWFGYFRYR